MSEHDIFDRILEMLYAAMLGAEHWPATCGLIDEACGSVGSAVLVAEGLGDDRRGALFVLQVRGERRVDLERDYLENYHRTDERIRRCHELSFDLLVPVADMYTEEERKTSPAYNEFLRRCGGQKGLNVRLRGPEGCSHIGWAFGDPIAPGGWESGQIALIERLLPHVRQFVAVRRALASAGGLGASMTELLDNPRLGVVHLDRSGRMVAANDRASELLQRGDALTDRAGCLRARLPEDNTRLERLLGLALPAHGGVGESGSVALRRRPPLPQLVVHVRPSVARDSDFGGQLVAVLVLIAEEGRQWRIDPALVGPALGLTPTETEVAVWLAEGGTVRSIALATGRQESSIYWHLRQIYAKRGISRQTDLVRLVLSLSDFA